MNDRKLRIVHSFKQSLCRKSSHLSERLTHRGYAEVSRQFDVVEGHQSDVTRTVDMHFLHRLERTDRLNIARNDNCAESIPRVADQIVHEFVTGVAREP